MTCYKIVNDEVIGCTQDEMYDWLRNIPSTMRNGSLMSIMRRETDRFTVSTVFFGYGHGTEDENGNEHVFETYSSPSLNEQGTEDIVRTRTISEARRVHDGFVARHLDKIEKESHAVSDVRRMEI